MKHLKVFKDFNCKINETKTMAPKKVSKKELSQIQQLMKDARKHSKLKTYKAPKNKK